MVYNIYRTVDLTTKVDCWVGAVLIEKEEEISEKLRHLYPHLSEIDICEVLVASDDLGTAIDELPKGVKYVSVSDAIFEGFEWKIL